MSRAALLQYAFPTAAAVVAVGVGAATALDPIATVAVVVAVIIGTTVLLLLTRLRMAWIPLLFVASATLLPLLEVAQRPADNYVAIGALILAAFGSLTQRRLERTTLVLAGLGILTFAVVASAAYGPPGASYDSAARFTSYVAFAALLTRLNAEARRSVIAGCLTIGVVLSGSIYATVIGYVRLDAYQDLETTEVRYGGLIGHPNFAAYFLSLCLIYVITRPGWSALHRYPLIAVYAGAVLITGSRGALVALGIALLVAVRQWWKRTAIVGGIGYVLLSLVGIGVMERFVSLLDSGGLEGQNSAGWRLRQWGLVFSLHDPWDATGVGWLHSQDLLITGLGTHNGFLQVWAELGLIGCLGLVLLVTGLVKLARGRGPIAVAILVFVLFANVGDPVLLYPATTYLSLALLYSLPTDESERTTETEESVPPRIAQDRLPSLGDATVAQFTGSRK